MTDHRPVLGLLPADAVHGILPSLQDRAVAIDLLKPHPKNARRRGEQAQAELRRSLEVNGQYKAVVARVLQQARGFRLELLLGHGTVEQAKALGWTHVAVDLHEGISNQEAARIVAVDNRTSDLADYDLPKLEELLSLIPDLEGSGYQLDYLSELQAINAAAGTPVALTDPDDAPSLPAGDTVSRQGDVWQLGPHKLVVGDATSDEAWLLLLGGVGLVDAVWTDPPYGVSYQGGTEEKLTIENDDLSADGLEAFLREALGRACARTRTGGAWYVTYADKAGSALAFVRVLHELGVYRHSIAWVKDRFVLSHGDYHSRYEPMAYGWCPGGPRLVPVVDRTQDTVWEIPRPSSSREHPTMKPVELITRALENSTKPGALVGDPFAGSGSTLIACHQTGRRAALIEKDPRYADVICRRFQEHTGVLPERAGLPVDFASAAEEALP